MSASTTPGNASTLSSGPIRRTVPGLDSPAARNAWIAGPRQADLPPTVRAVVDRWARVATLMNGFYWQLYAGRLTTPYPHEEVGAALAESAATAGS